MGRSGAAANRGMEWRRLSGEDARWRPRGVTEGCGVRRGDSALRRGRQSDVEVEAVQGVLPSGRGTSAGAGALEERVRRTRTQATDRSGRRGRRCDPRKASEDPNRKRVGGVHMGRRQFGCNGARKTLKQVEVATRRKWNE